MSSISYVMLALASHVNIPPRPDARSVSAMSRPLNPTRMYLVIPQSRLSQLTRPLLTISKYVISYI